MKKSAFSKQKSKFKPAEKDRGSKALQLFEADSDISSSEADFERDLSQSNLLGTKLSSILKKPSRENHLAPSPMKNLGQSQKSMKATPLQSILKKTPSVRITKGPSTDRSHVPGSMLLYESSEKKMVIRRGKPLYRLRNYSQEDLHKHQQPEIFTSYTQKPDNQQTRNRISLDDRMNDLKLIPKHGFASTAAGLGKGTDVGFQHRNSENINRIHMNRDINYGRHQKTPWLEKGFFSTDMIKFEPTYPNYNSVTVGRAKVNDMYESTIPNLRRGTRLRRDDTLDHYSTFLPGGVTVVPRIETPKGPTAEFHPMYYPTPFGLSLIRKG
ncbi:unnamed protein product [Moneuplotes crassus]|uniref:Uncharacterized protein n=1 Tax=Euplotes crassus TaxID=5936 RepID=A0AAD1UI81_EUPCR|nr:unnamed protein product [Moneuplotes crassus]